LNVAARKKFLFANPCAGVEFPARIEGLFRPHYVSWSEQQKIELHAPDYLRNVIRIVTETGLRIHKELTPMKKDQLPGMQRCGEQVFAIFAFTIFVRHTLHGLAPAALRTNGSRSY
jgi:hypothetical protein